MSQSYAGSVIIVDDDPNVLKLTLVKGRVNTCPRSGFLYFLFELNELWYF